MRTTFTDTNGTEIELRWEGESLILDASKGNTLTPNHVHALPEDVDGMIEFIGAKADHCDPTPMTKSERGFMHLAPVHTTAGVTLQVSESSAWGPPRTRVYIEGGRTPIALTLSEASAFMGCLMGLRALFEADGYWRNTDEYRDAYGG